MALLGVAILAIWLGQLLVFLFFPRSLPTLLWYLVNGTEPLTGVRVQWTEVLEADDPDVELSGSDYGDAHEHLERALLINCEKGRVSSIVIKNFALSSLWDLLFRWRCEILVDGLHVHLRRQKKKTGVKKKKSSSRSSMRKLLKPWFWRYLLRCISLFVPDTFLNASDISITDSKAHRKTNVESVTAQVIGRGIWNMTAGAVVTGVVVKDTEPAFSQRLISIDSICVQWETENNYRVVQNCSVVVGKTIVSLDGHDLMTKLAPMKKKDSESQGSKPGTKKLFDPSALVTAALAQFANMPELFCVYCTSLEVSAPLGGYRAVAPGVKLTRKRRHSLMHMTFAPPEGKSWAQEATIPYLATCMRLLRMRERLSSKPGTSFSTAIDTPTHAAGSLFGKPAALALKLQTAYAAPPDRTGTNVPGGTSAPVSARSTQPQTAANEKRPSAALDSGRSKQAPTLQSMLPLSQFSALSTSAEMHELGFSSQQGNPLGDSGVFEAPSGDISSSVAHTHGSESTQSSAQGRSGAGSAPSTFANPLEPSTFRSTSDGKQEADESTDGYLTAQDTSGTGSRASADTSGHGMGPEQPVQIPEVHTVASPRGKKLAMNVKRCRRTVSMVVSTGILSVTALGGGVTVFNGASKSSFLLDGPAEGKAEELQALTVAMGVKDMHAALLCASFRTFEETHRILQMLSDPTVSQLGVSISPSAQSATDEPANSLEYAAVGNPAAVSTEIADTEAAVTAADQPAFGAAQNKLPISSSSSSAKWSLSQLDNSASGEQTQAPRGLQKIQQTTAAALKYTSWQLNLQIDDDATLMLLDGGSREAEKHFGRPGAPKCRLVMFQCGRSVAALGAAPQGCMLPIEVAGYEKVTTISSLASPFVVAQLPSHATGDNASTFTPTPHQESLVDRQIAAAAATPGVQKCSGGERFAVVVTCQDACTAFTTAFSNESVGLAAAHKHLWEEGLQAVSAADQWDVDNLAEGPKDGLSGARLLHLLQQDHVFQHAVSWSHLSFEVACDSTTKDFAGPYEVSAAIGLSGLYADMSPHQAMDALEAALSAQQFAQSYRTRKPSHAKISNYQEAAVPALKPEIATFTVSSKLTDCQVTWSQLAAQQPFGSTLPQRVEAQNPSQGSQISASTSAISASNKSLLSLPAHSRSLGSHGSSGVHFLFLHDCWTLASLGLDASYNSGTVECTASVEGASWGCQWQELRGGHGQKLLDVYSVSSPRFLPHIPGMDPGELYRLLSPDLDVHPMRFHLTDSDLMPCSFVARRRQAVFVDDRFHDAPSVTHIASLRLHQALVQSDARRVCSIGSILAQATNLDFDEPWVPDANPSTSHTSESVEKQSITVDIQDCNTELDIDIGLIHLAAAQHVTRLADWLANLISTLKPRPLCPQDPAAAGKLLPSTLQPQPGSSVPHVIGNGAMSTQSSTISASYDIQNGSPSMEQLSSAVSMQTAASLTPAPSGPGKSNKAIKKFFKKMKVSLKGFSASCAIGGRDTVNLQFDGWATQAGECWKFQSLSVFMNGCPVMEALGVGAQIRVKQEEVTGVEDLKAEVKTVSLSFTGRTAVFFVPHSQDPGRLYAFSRMWEKPVLQVVKAHMQDLKESVVHAKTLLKSRSIRTATSNASMGASTSPRMAGLTGDQANASAIPEEGGKKPSTKLRICLSCDMSELAMRIENHSLERKLTLLYPVRKRTAALQTALSSAMQTYTSMHETSIARATGKRSDRSDRSVVNEPEHPEVVEDRLSQSLIAHDMCQCIDTLAVANASRIDQPGHLFNIACCNVRGSISVDGLDAGLDRATQGLTVSNAQRVQLALKSDSVVVRFGTMQNPMLEATSLGLNGAVIMARLACLPPQTDQVVVKVGSWHSIPVSVSRSGCRPPVKAYTDLQADLSDVHFQITAGLEPAFAAMSQCTKRIIPPSRVLGDGSLPPPDPNESPVAWWDRMRYMWRGRMHCKMSDACFTVSTALTPDADATKQRMNLRAKVFDLSSDPDAQLKLGLESTTATLLTHHHEKRSRPDAPLLRVPLFSLSNATITSNLSIELPNGRALGAHHIFPTIAMGQRVHSEGVQGPVDINSVLAAQSMGANINIAIRSLAIPGMGDTQTIPLAQAGVVYYSEEMMAFIRDLQSAFGSPPRYLRRAFKRSEDFWNRRTARAASGPKLSLGELFLYLNLNIHGVDCAMQHHVVASGDLGEVHARPEDVNVECRWSFTSSSAQLSSADTAGSLDMDLALNSMQSLKSVCAFPYARGPAVKSMMSSLSVSATNVRMLRLEMTPPSAARGSSLDHELETGTFHPVHAQDENGSVSGTSDGTNHCKAYGWEDMGSIRSLSVFQAPAPPSNTDEKRPIIVVSESAHLIISETSRQALGSIILHCKAPFGPRSAPSSAAAPADVAADDERPSLQDASSDLTGRLQDLVQDPRSASSFQRGQLDLQELVLNAGQVVELPAADYVSNASGGDQGKSSHKKASSTSDVLDKAAHDESNSYALRWKVQVSDLQVALLSTRRLGTAQFVADDCNVTHSIKNATEYTDAVASNAALYIMSHDVDMQNPVCWLEKGVSGYSLPDMSQQVNPIRLCVQPCQLQFRSQAAHAKSEQKTAKNSKNAPVQYLHMKVDMKSAHIQTSSYEYDVLTDVISHLIVSPMPQVPTMARHQRSTPVDHEPSLCTLRNAMAPTLRNMWRQQHLLAAMNSCTPALGYLPRDSALLFSKPAPPPVPDLSFDFHYPSGGTPASPASESGATPGTHLRMASQVPASSRGPFKGLLARSPMHLNHGPLRRSPIRNDTHSQASASGMPKSARSLSARNPSSTPLTDAAFCPLRASVETMAATQSKVQASLDAAPSAGAATADSGPLLEAAISPPPCTTPPSATGSTPHAWGGSRNTAPSPEHRPPLSAHRKSNSMGCRSMAASFVPELQQGMHLTRASNSHVGGALSHSQSPVRGPARLALSLDASPIADQAGRDQASRVRPPSPLKAGMRPTDTVDTGPTASTPSLMTGNPRHFLPLDMDRVGELAHLAGYEDAELNSKQRQIQLQLQFNQIRDYLTKSDAEVFSKCIVPFLKADSYLQSGEISEDVFVVMLHTCLINWLDNDTTTQEKILESLEEAMEKERLVLEEALIRRRRAEDLSHSVQLHLFIQQLSWTLHKPDGKPLVSVEGSDISFSRTHHRDRTGYCKAQIRDLNVRDLTASLAISKQLPKGMMLSKLKDTAWRKEGFLLVNVIRGRPTPDEVVYNHIDIKLHPLLVQLDGNMISALTSFFKVQKAGADVEEKRLDKVMGMSVIAKAERLRSKLHSRQESIDEGSQVASTTSMNLQGVGSVQMGSVLSLRPSLSVMSSMSAHEGDASHHNYPLHRQHADPESGLPMAAPVVRAGSTMSSVPSLDMQALHTQSLLDSSAFRAHRGSMETRVRVSLEPRVHRYQNVTFSPTIVSISLKVDNVKFARCQDKVIKVPDQRYQNMQNARPATLMSKYGWDLACSFLRGILTIGGSSKSTLRQSVSTDAIKKDKMTGEEKMTLPSSKPKPFSGKALLSKMKRMGGAGTSNDKS